VCMHTPAGSSAATFNGSSSNGRLYRSHRIPLLRGCAVPLIAALCVIAACPVSAQSPGALPTVTPVQVQPIGPANGGGVVTRVTYEMRLAANDAGVAAAANDARYVSRAVTIGGPTMGGIVRGVAAGASRLAPWVGAALLAYEAYKWYTDANGKLTAPGENIPSVSCGAGEPFFSFGNSSGSGCSVPAAIAQAKANDLQYYTSLGWTNISLPGFEGCVPAGPNQNCSFSYQHVMTRFGNTVTETKYDSVHWGVGSGQHTDPAYSTDAKPVTDTQLGDLAQTHPEWWPDMLHDPLTNQPLITPEIASDMDALKHQIAPEYGVDPQTIPQTTPDPNYQQGQAQPRPQSLPDYCAWAARACKHYDFVEDKLTIPTFDPTMGPDDPVSQVMVDKTDDGSASLDASGFLGGGACPGLPAIEYFGQSIDYSEGLCRTAGLFGPWLVGMGYALALLIGLRLKAGG